MSSCMSFKSVKIPLCEKVITTNNVTSGNYTRKTQGSWGVGRQQQQGGCQTKRYVTKPGGNLNRMKINILLDVAKKRVYQDRLETTNLEAGLPS